MYKVIRNEYIGEDMYLMEVNGKFKGEMGQFYMLRAWDNYPLSPAMGQAHGAGCFHQGRTEKPGSTPFVHCEW